jgi:hypothetical protein
MTIDEIIQELNGKTANNVPKASFAFVIDMWSIDKERARSIQNLSICKPELKIEKHGNYVQVDFIYISPMDADLEKQWKALEYYGSLQNEIKDDSEELPVGSLIITSTEWEGYFHVTAIAPVCWALTSNKPGKQTNIIRVVFEDTKFLFYYDENLNLTNARAEAERELNAIEEQLIKAELEMAKKERED